jgi:hypothetical protein
MFIHRFVFAVAAYHFVEQNFNFKPGCDGVPVNTRIACNDYY